MLGIFALSLFRVVHKLIVIAAGVWSLISERSASYNFTFSFLLFWSLIFILYFLIVSYRVSLKKLYVIKSASESLLNIDIFR